MKRDIKTKIFLSTCEMQGLNRFLLRMKKSFEELKRTLCGNSCSK